MCTTPLLGDCRAAHSSPFSVQNRQSYDTLLCLIPLLQVSLEFGQRLAPCGGSMFPSVAKHPPIQARERRDGVPGCEHDDCHRHISKHGFVLFQGRECGQQLIKRYVTRYFGQKCCARLRNGGGVGRKRNGIHSKVGCKRLEPKRLSAFTALETNHGSLTPDVNLLDEPRLMEARIVRTCYEHLVSYIWNRHLRDFHVGVCLSKCCPQKG